MEYTKRDHYKLQHYLAFVPIFGLIAVITTGFINVKKIVSLKWAILYCFASLLAIALLFSACGLLMGFAFASLAPKHIEFAVILSCLIMYIAFVLADMSMISIQRKFVS